MTAESTLQAAIRAEAPRLGVYLWRNNSGALMDDRGVLVRFGLGNDSPRINKVLKSSDLIGIRTGTGQLVAVECKHAGWIGVRTERERAQENFIRLVRQAGGIAGFARSVEDFRRLLG